MHEDNGGLPIVGILGAVFLLTVTGFLAAIFLSASPAPHSGPAAVGPAPVVTTPTSIEPSEELDVGTEPEIPENESAADQ